ncbi:hypothetical protein BV898_13910 [Hypsibius exemplaris]|uniref:Uncharacterized protein n=1 Tax=Hypsibius exemplaris TaxID=2072580 RepID=A0A1W0W9B5_HYPEX|nr:hypothetical protein BV898_13910 [Hypsibius exemplaris]
MQPMMLRRLLGAFGLAIGRTKPTKCSYLSQLLRAFTVILLSLLALVYESASNFFRIGDVANKGGLKITDVIFLMNYPIKTAVILTVLIGFWLKHK